MIQRGILFSLLLTFCSFEALTQVENSTWVSGRNEGYNNRIKFSGDSLIIDSLDIGMNIENTQASISDENGNLLFYTNGKKIHNANFELMENGDSLNYGYFWVQDTQRGYWVPDGAMIIPQPWNDSLYYLFHIFSDTIDHPMFVIFKELRYSIVNINANNGLGQVESKNNVIINDTLSFGKLDAVKHANGRDWWIVQTGGYSDRYFRFLLSPSGLSEPQVQFIGPPLDEFPITAWQSTFSPDGSKMAVITDGSNSRFDLMDFDRCTGLLSNYRSVLTYPYLNGGVSFSPDSKYLYVSNIGWVYQIPSIATDLLAEMDTVGWYWPDSIFLSRFGRTELGPNGKIYITTVPNSVYYHVIHEPNNPGAACNLEQFAVKLPNYVTQSLGTAPNYSLGPLAGSPCDTIFQTPPIAHFAYSPDSNSLAFTDATINNPILWSWDFGDGGSSTAQHPDHTYATPDNYQVCLTASNPFGSDTYCEEIAVDFFTKVTEIAMGEEIRIYPNPAHNNLTIETPDKQGQFFITSAKGQALRSGSFQNKKTIDISEIPKGIYQIKIVIEKQEWVEQLVIQ